MFFSPSTGGFYDPAIHCDLPDDAIRITRRHYVELVEGRATGQEIVQDRSGKLGLRLPKQGLAELRDLATRIVKSEARRRILAIASLERQANDAAALAMATWSDPSPEARAALDRRKAIDAIRAASNAIEAVIARMPAANLKAFDASTHPLWPSE